MRIEKVSTSAKDIIAIDICCFGRKNDAYPTKSAPSKNTFTEIIRKNKKG